MAGPLFYWLQLDAEAEDGEKTVRGEVKNIPVNKFVRAHTMLTYVGSSGKHQGFGTNCYIEEYVENGTPQGGATRLLSGTNITDIKLRLDVWQGSATGLLMVEVF